MLIVCEIAAEDVVGPNDGSVSGGNLDGRDRTAKYSVTERHGGNKNTHTLLLKYLNTT